MYNSHLNLYFLIEIEPEFMKKIGINEYFDLMCRRKVFISFFNILLSTLKPEH